MPLIDCEVSLTLSWYENCLKTSKAATEDDITTATVRINNPINAVFKITDCKLYVLVVTFSSEEDNELLNKLK